jgi:type III restriction enzyme
MAEEALFDTNLHDEIAARLDLRAANKDAVQSIILAIARHYDVDHSPRPFEGVADVATGVGKTFILAATMEYMAYEGHRNFAIITPGRTILNKTIDNFAEGHPKSLLRFMSVKPVVITSETFTTPLARAVMDDDSTVKIYIFTVQALTKPATKAGRKTHAYQEGLGAGFYDHLKSKDDLVIFADEHHVYSSPVFSKTVRDLDPFALIGLTATPNRSTPEEQIIFRYPLAAAIADRVVKTPVLVGRSDDRNDPLTKLQDGVKLLEMKERAIARYAPKAGKALIYPLMLVIAPTIAEADEISAIIEDPSFAGGTYRDRVLTVHSKAADEALDALGRLEDVDNPYRVIISVGMLKEGWDVKSVYVIASLRASVSDILTEQTLGRGMRLPFDQYTGIELLDTLEVLGHERYEELLRKADVLNEQFVDWRTRADLRRNQHGDLVPVQERLNISVPIVESTESPPEPTASSLTSTTPNFSLIPTSGGFAIRTFDDVVRAGANELHQLELQLIPREDVPEIRIPYVKTESIHSPFSLADIIDIDPFRAAGRRIAADPSGQLRRITISARRRVGNDGRPRVDLVTAPAVDAIVSAAVTMSLFSSHQLLVDALLLSPIVPARAGEKYQAERIVEAFIEGLGSEAEAILSAASDRAAGEIIRIVSTERQKYSVAPTTTEVVTIEPLKPVRKRREQTNPDRFGPFDRISGYEFEKSLYAQDWFDSSPERDLANIVDQSSEVQSWVRLQRNDLKILWADARDYNPDFVVRESGGRQWIVEVKADRDRDSEDVSGKLRAAKRWANHVNADPRVSERWGYLLVVESDIRNAHGSWGSVAALGS